jgi:hypothetical protein
MTDALSTTHGGGSLAPSQPSHPGKVGDKRFTAQSEPGHRSSASIATRPKGGVLRGVKQLLRAAIHAPPRAGGPLRQARRELDAAHERLLKTMLNGEAPCTSRTAFNFALDQVVEAEAAFVLAGGRIAALHADDAAMLYMPSLDAFTFTELLLLRERLPRLMGVAPGMASYDPREQVIVSQVLHAVDKEIGARDRPFKAVLRVLSQAEPDLDELDSALYTLACTISARERRGENPTRFLGDLAASRGNHDLENAAAALASAPIRAAYATASGYHPREPLAISAHDGGAGACARILKHVLDDCILSRLIVRARRDLRQGTLDGRTFEETAAAVLDMLAHGVTAMNGGIAPVRSQRDSLVIALLTNALAGYDGPDLQGYMETLNDSALREVERHMSSLPAARRRTLQHAIDAARRNHATESGKAGLPEGSARNLFSQAMENVGMRASPILARVFARMQAGLDNQARLAPSPMHSHLRAMRPPAALMRMSFDVTARTDGTYEVSMTARLGTDAGNDTASMTCKSLVGIDLRPLRGEFRQAR